DLHVLSTPPAFALSQDQTLQLSCCAEHPEGAAISTGSHRLETHWSTDLASRSARYHLVFKDRGSRPPGKPASLPPQVLPAKVPPTCTPGVTPAHARRLELPARHPGRRPRRTPRLAGDWLCNAAAMQGQGHRRCDLRCAPSPRGRARARRRIPPIPSRRSG